jgi:hypothetical protein
VRSEITRLANSIEADVRSHPSVVKNGMSVDSGTATTDRFRANVTITHAGGLAAQAKHGVLTRAAAAAGLEVRAQ